MDPIVDQLGPCLEQSPPWYLIDLMFAKNVLSSFSSHLDHTSFSNSAHKLMAILSFAMIKIKPSFQKKNNKGFNTRTFIGII